MPTETIQTVIPDMSYDDREYVIFDDGEGAQIWVHDKRHGVLETLPTPPEDPT